MAELFLDFFVPLVLLLHALVRSLSPDGLGLEMEWISPCVIYDSMFSQPEVV